MRYAILWFLVVNSSQIWSHGEDRPGPNGGFISMPGAFHVELVPVSKSQIRAYLLDAHWRNPTLQDSTIDLIHGTVQARCARKSDHFICDFPEEIDLTKHGELKIKAVRKNQVGNTVNYKLPFKLKSHH